MLAIALSVGDGFPVLVDPLDFGAWEVEFFVMICTRAMHIVQAEKVTDN